MSAIPDVVLFYVTIATIILLAWYQAKGPK
jgi:hypothetical protein